MSKGLLSAFSLIILLSIPGCLGNIFGPDDPRLVTVFVNGQGLHDRQPIQIIMQNDDVGLIFFKVKFGSPHDCIAGCFYSTGYGLKCRSKIGWMRVNDYDYVLDLESLDYFDIESTDTLLFNENMWSQLETTDKWLHWGPFLQMLASDSDTPVPKLLAIAKKLNQYIAPWIAWNLLDNPVVQVNREILAVILSLPWPSDSSTESIKQRAQELLNALEPGVL